MKTIFYLMISLLFVNCEKGIQTDEQTVPDIANGHNEVLSSLLVEINRYPVNE